MNGLEKGLQSTINKIESVFESDEAKLLLFAPKVQKWTKQIQTWQGNATVEQIESMVGVEPEAEAIVSFLVAANESLQLLLSKQFLDAVNGTLLMVGAKITNLLSGNKFSVGTAITAFQKMWDAVKS